MEIHAATTINPATVISTGMLWLGTTGSAQAAIVINEIDYDQPGSDTAEFVELFNTDATSVLLDGYTLDLVNGSNGSSYHTVDLSGLLIAANGYLVLCSDSAAVANCTVDAAAGSWMQNGGNDGDAVALFQGTSLLDSIAYEGIGSHLGPYAEGNTFTDADSASLPMSIARLPNGIDTNDNAGDFGSACLTPGGANISGSGDCSIDVNPVPVPAAVWLFGSGLLGLTAIGRRKITA